DGPPAQGIRVLDGPDRVKAQSGDKAFRRAQHESFAQTFAPQRGLDFVIAIEPGVVVYGVARHFNSMFCAIIWF
ncbi:MAG: hypothetical protein ACU0BG_01070, partial [Paracoccus sp. (in: a-proteobacteria)]|uniref:hypothetical protein n=1 Tax=Paracoccus sp. TaxID=267 RepID=UPI00405A4579